MTPIDVLDIERKVQASTERPLATIDGQYLLPLKLWMDAHPKEVRLNESSGEKCPREEKALSREESHVRNRPAGCIRAVPKIRIRERKSERQADKCLGRRGSTRYYLQWRG